MMKKRQQMQESKQRTGPLPRGDMFPVTRLSPNNLSPNPKEETKQVDEAVEDFNKAIQLDSYYFEAYYGKGLCEVERGNLQTAIKDFTKTLSIK